MSEFIKGQTEERNNLIMQVREVLDGADQTRGMTAEEMQKVERLEERIAELDAGLAVARRAEERKAEVVEAAAGFVPSAEVSDDNQILRAIASGEIRSHEFRAALTPTSGSGVVPVSFHDQVFEILKGSSPLFETSTVINTTGGNTLQVPQVTAFSSFAQVAAGSAVAESNPTLSNVNLGAWKYGALVSLSNELIADAGVDLMALIARISGQEIAYAAGQALTTGTGTVQPTGIVTAAGSGVVGTATAPTYENIVDLIFSVPGSGNARAGHGIMASTTGMAAIRKIKDGAGNYVFQPSIGVDSNGYVLGLPIYENPAMAAVGSSAKSVIAGKLDDYIVRQAGGIQVATSTDYAFNQDVTTFRVTTRIDGNLGATGSVKYFQGA